MTTRLARTYKFLLEWWNAIIAASSFAAVIVFNIVPPLEKYTSISIIVAVNAVVWLLIEIKVQLKPPARKSVVYANIRAAREDIVSDIEKRMRLAARDAPVELTLLGNKLRSMSDIVREVIDDMIHDRTFGHLSVKLFCIDPDYVLHRVLPGQISRSDQVERNRQYADMVAAHIADLNRFVGTITMRSSLKFSVVTYKEDPRCIAYIIDNDIIYWAGVTWSPTTSEFVGTANPCMMVSSVEPQFSALRAWLLNRVDLYAREAETTAKYHISNQHEKRSQSSPPA